MIDAMEVLVVAFIMEDVATTFNLSSISKGVYSCCNTLLLVLISIIFQTIKACGKCRILSYCIESSIDKYRVTFLVRFRARPAVY